MELQGISTALKTGCRLHAFLSGGGLRVIRLEENNVLRGYGEHPHVDDALSHAAEDYLAGGREYAEVYGKTKTHYLTGENSSSSELDAWVLRGHTFDAWQEEDMVVVSLLGLEMVDVPKDLQAEALLTNKIVLWENRGHRYEIRRSASMSGMEMRCLNPENGTTSFTFYFTKIGRGKTFNEAVEAAFLAEPIEIDKA